MKLETVVEVVGNFTRYEWLAIGCIIVGVILIPLAIVASLLQLFFELGLLVLAIVYVVSKWREVYGKLRRDRLEMYQIFYRDLGRAFLYYVSGEYLTPERDLKRTLRAFKNLCKVMSVSEAISHTPDEVLASRIHYSHYERSGKFTIRFEYSGTKKAIEDSIEL